MDLSWESGEGHAAGEKDDEGPGNGAERSGGMKRWDGGYIMS